MTKWLCCISFLIAIVAANLSVQRFGVAALPFTAFVLIPFDLVARDVLHDEWNGRWLWWKMAGLIAAGSILTYALNTGAGMIAAASVLAFSAASVVDAVVYHLMSRRARINRMVISNAFSAFTDSAIFPIVAFGIIDGTVFMNQTASKMIGGVIWSIAFVALLENRGPRQ